MRKWMGEDAPLSFLDCSALIKLMHDYSDIFVGHTTWTDYYSMVRVFKHYKMALTSTDGSPVAASRVSFSSRPAMLSSKDDFYIMDSGLVTLETTNGIYNKSLYGAVKAEGSVLCWMRSIIANRIASTGREWTTTFARYNSGTYNNQWMVVDYKAFVPGKGPAGVRPNTLWIIEQVPGVTMSGDVTAILKQQGYWPSYNVPYFSYIYNISGWPAMAAQYGDDYTYDKCVRARIFRRNETGVESLEGLGAVLQLNDWEVDPLSADDPANAISSRYDLRYLIQKQGFAFGGIDSKTTKRDWVLRAKTTGLKTRVISGPSHQHQPPFVWSSSKFNSVPHRGMPNAWNFDWIQLTSP